MLHYNFVVRNRFNRADSFFVFILCNMFADFFLFFGGMEVV